MQRCYAKEAAPPGELFAASPRSWTTLNEIMWNPMNQYANMTKGRPGDSPAGNVGVGISAQLRQYYQAVQDEAIPDRFLELLDKLDAAEKKQAEALTSVNHQTAAMDSVEDDAR